MTSTLPPSLKYFVVYNAALKVKRASPAHPEDAQHGTAEDDEDIEEQSQILFYTAKDHAVSRDRVLRQVGLAKALVNFSTLFGADAGRCESVHSQTHRMVMLQPEPDYWIHACIDLSKSARVATPAKGRGKLRKPEQPVYDYHEAGLHDGALRAQLQRGYEAFVVTHGSFTSILNSQGKEALEIQLERFFTVWAWTWDVEKPPPVCNYAGIRIHPLSSTLLPIIDSSALAASLPPQHSPIVLTSDSIITSKDSHPESSTSPALIQHFLDVFAKQRQLAASSPSLAASSSSLSATDEDPTPRPSRLGDNTKPKKLFPNLGPSDSLSSNAGKRILGEMTAGMNAGMNATVSAMDVRKWSWPGYLTFGVNGTKGEKETDKEEGSEEMKDMQESISEQPETRIESSQVTEGDKTEVPNDTDEISSPQIRVHASDTTDGSVDAHALEDALNEVKETSDTDGCYADEEDTNDEYTPDGNESKGSSSPRIPFSELPDSSNSVAFPSHSPLPKPIFRKTFVHISHLGEGSLETKQYCVHYLFHADLLLALVPTTTRDEGRDKTLEVEDLVQANQDDLAFLSQSLLDQLRPTIDEEEGRIANAFQQPTVQSVLQRSQHVVSLSQGRLHIISGTSSAKQSQKDTNIHAMGSWHLHEGKTALGRNSDVLEIYSRRQNPQDWHLVKRLPPEGNGVDSVEVYMEIGRKEASLVDVDGEVAGVIRRAVG